MAKTKQTDQKTLDLIKEVNRQKAEISKAERPNYLTNCSFAYKQGSSDIINIHVASDIRDLICIVAFLQDKENSYEAAAGSLGVDAPAFTWCGFSVVDWTNDIRLRIGKVQIATKKKKLELLESRLNAIISPELRAELELEAISQELT